MSMNLRTSLPPRTVEEIIFYPESDGKPMAENTRQFLELVTIEGNLEILFEHDPNVFVAGDLLWYPVEGNNTIRQAPDVMVVFGRPKGHRGSYLQWKEENIAPQVVFEILSPGNRKKEMDEKFAFYERYGVEEYYLNDPGRGRLQGWLRNDQNRLAPIETMRGWRSPRLGITFGLNGLELNLTHPDGSRFLTFVELNQRRLQAEAVAEAAETLAQAALERAHDAEKRVQVEAAARAAAEEQAQIEAAARVAAEERIRLLEEQLRQAKSE